jgi:hypothetical protein
MPLTNSYPPRCCTVCFLKDSGTSVPVIVDVPERDAERSFEGIRCPLCAWRPTPASRWCCICIQTPEPFFVGCGTDWNTFETRGRCPGCGHQWQWTSFLRCAQWSLHERWYEREPA